MVFDASQSLRVRSLHDGREVRYFIAGNGATGLLRGQRPTLPLLENAPALDDPDGMLNTGDRRQGGWAELRSFLSVRRDYAASSNRCRTLVASRMISSNA